MSFPFYHELFNINPETYGYEPLAFLFYFSLDRQIFEAKIFSRSNHRHKISQKGIDSKNPRKRYLRGFFSYFLVGLGNVVGPPGFEPGTSRL